MRKKRKTERNFGAVKKIWKLYMDYDDAPNFEESGKNLLEA